MKFSAKIKGLTEALDPVVAVATTTGIKDYEHANRISICASNNGLQALADNGLSQLRADLNSSDFDGLDYSCSSAGSVTIRAKEMKEVLSSFSPNDTVSIELLSAEGDGASELRFVSASDSDVYQSLSTVSDSITFSQSVSKQISSENASPLEIRRDIFTQASSRLAFAHGYEDFRPEYKYWVIRASEGACRFVAGSGARFAVLDLEGDGITDATEKRNVLIPAPQSPTITKLTSKISDERIRLHTLDSHFVIETKNFCLSLPNYEPDIEWPDESKFLNRESSYKMTTRLGDWPSIAKGVMATRNDEFKQTNQYHIAKINIDPTKNEILVEASGSTMRSRRKAKISELSGNLDKQHQIRIESCYLFDAFKSADEDDYAQWEFEDQGVVVLRFYASPEVGDPNDFAIVNDSTGLKERYAIFTASLSEDF